MKAIGIVNYLPVEDENAFIDFEAEKPVPAGDDILVAIKAIAVNPVDVKVRAGRGKEGAVEDPPRVIGWDASGVVEAVGPKPAAWATTCIKTTTTLPTSRSTRTGRHVSSGRRT